MQVKAMKSQPIENVNTNQLKPQFERLYQSSQTKEEELEQATAFRIPSLTKAM